jgi:hypothetical protein
MAGLDFNCDEDGTVRRALLYHPQRPCANPAPGIMMNKQQAMGVTRHHG